MMPFFKNANCTSSKFVKSLVHKKCQKKQAIFSETRLFSDRHDTSQNDVFDKIGL